MSRLLISKKGTFQKTLLFFGVLCIVMVVMFFVLGLGDHQFGNSEKDDFILKLPAILLAMAGILCLATGLSHGRTSINVYDDHIEGAGIRKGTNSVHNFYFTKDKNYTLQQSNGMLNISCGMESYTVNLSVADATEVYRFVNGISSSAPQNTPSYSSVSSSVPSGNKIATCPYCGTKGFVPAGKGMIKIICPNKSCNRQFDFMS